MGCVDGRETNAKVVNTAISSRVMILRGHSKSVKHISFHPNGNIVTTSSSDGSIYVFSVTSEEASLLKKIDGIIPAVEVESETSSKVAWHPDGTVFAAPTSLNGTISILLINNRRAISHNGRLGKGNCVQKRSYWIHYRSRLVSQRSLPRNLLHRRKSEHMANKRPNHHHHVPTPHTQLT